MNIEIPCWFLNSAGGLVGLAIISAIFLKGQKYRRKIREANKRHKERQKEQEKRQKEERQCKQQIARQNNDRLEDERLDRLLPGPWRMLYDFLDGYPKMSREAVLLSLVAFKNDTPNIPAICPGGFDLVLGVMYYNLGAEGNCRKECANCLGDYVKFPLDGSNA